MLFVVHDFETTGLPFHADANIDKQPRAIEFAAVLTDGVKILDQLEFICNPHMPIEPIITKITGLTDDDLCIAPDFGTFIPQIATLFAKGDVIISHNLSFDKGIMKGDLERRELGLEAVNWPGIEICTVEQTMHQFGRRMKMQDLYTMYCGEYVQKHRAMDDVLLLVELCKTLGVFNVFSAA